jgi:hypothetical protein
MSRASPSMPETDLDDLLEAIYAAPAQGWTEAELVPLIQRALPDPRMVWDVLRSFAEAGWIDPHVSTSWRARRWRLRPPGLIEISSHCVLVDGAIGARLRRRLTSAVSACGGEMEIRNGVSKFAPATFVVQGVGPATLAAQCGWSWNPARRPDLRNAPDCWNVDLRTIEGRTLAGIWSFQLGFFRTDSSVANDVDGIAIERWRRERGDDRDIYRVRGGGPDLMLSSRTAAILEGHRRARRGLYQWSDGRLQRASSGGYLPLTVARALRCRSLAAAGPALFDGKVRSYEYVVELVDAHWLAAVFGSAVEVPSVPDAGPWMHPRIRARRMGIRQPAADLLAREPENHAEWTQT